MINMFLQSGPASSKARMSFAVSSSVMGMSNQALVVDVADSACWDLSSETVNDISGNGLTLSDGRATGTNTADWSSSGIAGNLSKDTYALSTGENWFTMLTGSFWTDWHFENESWSVFAWLYIPTSQSVDFNVFGNGSAPGDEGFRVHIARLGDDGRPEVKIMNGVGTETFAPTNTDIIYEGEWICLGWSWAEATGTSFVSVNGTAYSLTSDTIVSPTATAPHASNLPTVGGGARAGSGSFSTNADLDSGGRFAGLLAFDEQKLSEAQHMAFFQATRGRFGI